MDFSIDILIEYLPRFLDGAWLTLQLLILAVTIGGIFSVPLALARCSRNRWLNGAAYAYTFFFRGTPLLVQLFLVYYGSAQYKDVLQSAGLWTLFQEAYFCAVFTLTLNTIAYTAEILRGGILAVPAGEVEAARAFGMSPLMVYRRVILPQAYHYALPAYGNEVVLLMKGTALVSFIAMMDLMGVTKTVFSRTFALEVFAYAMVLYLVITWTIDGIVRLLEHRLSAHMRPVEAVSAVRKAGEMSER